MALVDDEETKPSQTEDTINMPDMPPIRVPPLNTNVSNVSTGENAEVHFFRRTSLVSLCTTPLQIDRKDTELNIWDDFGNDNKIYNVEEQDSASEDIQYTDDDFISNIQNQTENQAEKISHVKTENQNQNSAASMDATVDDDDVLNSKHEIEETFVVENVSVVSTNKNISVRSNLSVNISNIEDELECESSILQMVGSPMRIDHGSMSFIDQNKLDEQFFIQQQCRMNKDRLSNKLKLKTISRKKKKQEELKDNNNECVDDNNRSECIETNENVKPPVFVTTLKYVAAFCAVCTISFIAGHIVYNKKGKDTKERWF